MVIVFLAVEVSFSGIDITNGSSPPFTLTCVSMNLPPTAVEWRLDGEGLTNISTTTVLDDRVTTQYTHKLTVTERKGGNYECIVTSFYFNLTVNPPIVDSATFTVHGKWELESYTFLSPDFRGS